MFSPLQQQDVRLPHKTALVDAGHCPCILIVEDEPIIAIDLRIIFHEHGYDVLGPATSVDMALRLLNRARPDVAVLDANLRGQTIAPVAERLQSLQIPFFLSSAYEAAQLQTVKVLANVENVQKPIEESRLLAAARRALGST
ncbi:response regulator [Paracoccus gahaiensis]|uniref:Response regulator n=1 Tax=Paracoccus gahaiensis TaxID=1706839 RepID=A0A4U0R4Z1_9RHOB|nr:response regulator [Paracoccus gahaiensis]TJZ89949.1 response regulator [Paracoccus gahaiensis]